MLEDRLENQATPAPLEPEEAFAELRVPPLSGAAWKILQMLQDEGLAPADLAGVIGTDPEIAERILRLVNSAEVGLPQEVEDLTLAVSLLGVKRIKGLVVGLSVSELLRHESPGFDHESFWCASLQRAAFAEAMAGRLCPGQEDEAFAGALLQDMAQPLLVGQLGDRYVVVMRRAGGAKRELIEVEQERLGWTHADAGAWIARSWKLSDPLVHCVELHHSTVEELAERELTQSVVAAVAASANLPYAAPFCTELGLPPDDYPAVCKATDNLSRGLSGLLGVRKPRRLPVAAAGGALGPPGGD